MSKELIFSIGIVVVRILLPLVAALLILKYSNKFFRKFEEKNGKLTYMTIAEYVVKIAVVLLAFELIMTQFDWVKRLSSQVTGNNIITICVVTAVTAVGTVVLFNLTNQVMHQQEARFGKQIHIKFLFNILKLFIILLAVATVGSQFGGFKSTINTILASSGIIALGISMAAQESLTNIIDGIFISMFKPFNIGDRVCLPEKDHLTGIVKEMNLRHTVVTTPNNTSFIIPNSIMSSAIVENSNFHNTNFSYPVDVSVSYDSDLDLAIELLRKAVTEHPLFVDLRTPEQIEAGEPAATVLVRDFGASGIDLRCLMRVSHVNESFLACSEVRIAVKKLYDEAGIVIPFTTIHIDNPGRD